MGGSDKEFLVRIVCIISENKPFDNAVLVEFDGFVLAMPAA